MSVTAQDVNKLRIRTGAGMMDCKNALIEANGDFEKAIDILRKRGQKLSDKRIGRETNEGLVLAKTNENQNFGIILALSCETDFVAKNENFIKLGNDILNIALQENPVNEYELLKFKHGNLTVNDIIIENIGKIGEKIEISQFKKLEAPLVVTYIHTGSNLGVLVGLKGAEKNNQSAINAGKDVAMQIAAMNPISLSKETVPKEVVAREFEIAKEQAKLEGKPDAVTEKIAEGKLNKFFKESTLLEQPFIKDPNLSVEKYLNSVVPGLTAVDFVRISIK